MSKTNGNGQPQHLTALERANRVRLARAALKREVAEGTRSVVDIIMDPPWCVESIQLSELLMTQRRWGRTRMRRILIHVGLPENKPLGTLTERQRTALVTALVTPASKRRTTLVDPRLRADGGS